MEEWKDIPGFEKRYQASTNGKVKSLARYVLGKNGSLKPIQETELKCKTNKYGYLTVRPCKEGIHFDFTVHRLIALTFIPNPLNLPEVNHKDGNKKNNHKDNLEWSTGYDNIKHAVENKLFKGRPGEKHHSCILQEADVLTIRNSKDTQSSLAAEYGVSASQISRIKNKKAWTHL